MDLPPSKRSIAMVFQSYALYPHMTVFNNMAFSLDIQEFSKNEITKRVTAAAKILQMEHLLDRKPAALSGGQRQRVAIGRSVFVIPTSFYLMNHFQILMQLYDMRRALKLQSCTGSWRHNYLRTTIR